MSAVQTVDRCELGAVYCLLKDGATIIVSSESSIIRRSHEWFPVDGLYTHVICVKDV